MSAIESALTAHDVTAECSTTVGHHNLVDKKNLPHYAQIWRDLLIDKEIPPTQGTWRVMVAGIPSSANGNDRAIQLICPDKGKLKTRLRPPAAQEFARLCFVIPPNGVDDKQIFDTLKSKTDDDIKSFLELAEEQSGEPFINLYREEVKHRTSRIATNFYREKFARRAKIWEHNPPIFEFVLLSFELWQAAQWLDRTTLITLIRKFMKTIQIDDLMCSIEIYYLIGHQVIERVDNGFRLGKVGQKEFEEIFEKSKHRMPNSVDEYLQRLIEIEESAQELEREILKHSDLITSLEEEAQTLRDRLEKLEPEIIHSKSCLAASIEKRNSTEITVPLEELQKIRGLVK